MPTPRYRLAPWVHMLLLGAALTVALVVLAATRPESLMWLVTHPEALAGVVMALSKGLGEVTRRLPHFKNGTSPREVDDARERLYSQVLRATDTLTVVQGELDLMYERVIRLRDSLPKE